jgi:GT2 family glycosyltransferase
MEDFTRIHESGFNAIRIYQMPSRSMLDAAEYVGLKIFGGLQWSQTMDFFSDPRHLSAATVSMAESLRNVGTHPALAGVYVGNEIPADLVRWMGPMRVKEAIEQLIDMGREIAPHLLFAYANYPSTEYLEPGNADFTAFNVYLEDPETFRNYIQRLHHIAGDRPLVISEFGLCTKHHSKNEQAELLGSVIDIANKHAVAGFTVFAWSDRWLSGGIEMLDWDFGLIDRNGVAKPALETVSERFIHLEVVEDRCIRLNVISAIVCTRDGRKRIGKCLNALEKSKGWMGRHVIVVDDGSTDGTADYVAEHFPHVDLLRLPPSGLSAARNAGAAIAKADILVFTDDDCEPDIEWLARIVQFLENHPEFAAVGGPNLPQKPRTQHEAVVCAAPGAPSHVMIDDTTAEHLPGCNIAVRKSAFDAIGGFDSRFHTAGDDVDFCWRLQEHGYRMGFDPGAFVWHWRRPSIRAFLKQQIGYGKAECLLKAKFPERFNRSGAAKWHGFIYGGGPIRVTHESVIYHGPMGSAGYQSLQLRMQPLRELDHRFASGRAHLMLAFVTCVTHLLRGWHRARRLMLSLPARSSTPPADTSVHEFAIEGTTRETILNQLLDRSWHACGPTEVWDMEKGDTKVLLATELGDRGYRRTLVRFQGSGLGLGFLR